MIAGDLALEAFVIHLSIPTLLLLLAIGRTVSIRSSSISLSSITEGSMETRRTSCLQVITTLTAPAPD